MRVSVTTRPSPPKAPPDLSDMPIIGEGLGMLVEPITCMLRGH